MSDRSATAVLEDAIDYTTYDDPVTRIGIGGMLMAFSMLVLPFVYVFGYYVDVIRGTLRGEDTPPVFSGDRIGDRFKHGVMGIVVALIHSIPLAVVIVGWAGVIGFGYAGAIDGLFIVAGFFGGLVVLGLMSLYVGFVVPAALLLYADTGSVSDAFSINALRELVTAKQYLVAYVFSLVLFSITGTAGGVVGLIPFVGVVVVGFVQFPAMVASSRMFAQAGVASPYEFTTEHTSVTQDSVSDGVSDGVVESSE